MSATMVDPQPEASSSRINLNIPRNLLLLPPSAALVGLVIGMSRGGSRARLRFLAENAHRPPKTIQGWYFYTKTRNYRVFYSAAQTGVKYALGLGGATGGLVLLEEGAGRVREQVVGVDVDIGKGKGRAVERKQKEGWREGQVRWEDGAVAGMIMGAGVGFIYTLPRPLFIRSVVIGTLLGGATSGLQSLQAKIGRLREEQEVGLRLPSALPPVHHTASGPLPALAGSEDDTIGKKGLVDRQVGEGEMIVGVPIDETMPTDQVREGEGEGSWWSWIPGWGK